MNPRYPLLIPAAMFLGFSAPAFAQFRCDCTSVVDSCEADVAIVGNSIEITTDHQQCARVDYFVDGQPFVSVAVEGEGRQEWIARTENPRVLVQSCQVCMDNSASSAAPSAQQQSVPQQRPTPGSSATSEDSSGALQALIEVRPSYPPNAQSQGLEGYVELQFTVGPQGAVEAPTVTASEPGTVFDQAALAAISRWRYPADPQREPQTVTERLEFRPLAESSRAPAVDAAAGPGAPLGAASEARNQCVREGSVYNYGEMIEVGLMNACDTPLMVFGCAEGTGRYQGRWVCTTSEEQQQLLVRSDDDRIGQSTTVSTADGPVPLTFTDRFFVSRAPNSEYWWLACGTDDADCRASARQWTRAVDRQLASIDPQGRSSVDVARSY